MAQVINRLTNSSVSAKKKPGRYADGNGLYLQVAKGGSKSWIFQFMLNGRSRQMGLGATHTFSLAEARTRARRCRQLLAEGIDPIEQQKIDRANNSVESGSIPTFKQCAEQFIKLQSPAWKNLKHARQWTATLEQYVYPKIGNLPVSSVETRHVLKVLEPIWSVKAETANRVRGRIEAILQSAISLELRDGPNPAMYRGHLENLLPKRAKVADVKHHAALPFPDCPAFMMELRARDAVSARGLEFLILAAARTGEVIGAKWTEIDLEAKVWIIPGERMKSGIEHRVPLSARALAILEEMKAVRRRESLAEEDNGEAGLTQYVFPGHKDKSPLSNMVFLQLLKRMERDDITAHGFRSSFKDWASEATRHANEVSEAALAHTISSKVEAAYRRGDLFEKRRKLMVDWDRYLSQPANSTVVRIGAGRV